ncbi:MAG: L-fucose/L-arabinose isomerase family protein [Spirochaetia bacterium]|nr:L-fucose/L-arabinose isomerase family protein [Spirochaetia bacterium]MCF7945853.1 L-fucose/L-arabinose isomerase family protein [Spirochaetia bacterium]
MEKIKIGLFGIGLNTYWDQFEGLYNRLVGYQDIVEEYLVNFSAELVNAGLVDDPIKARKTADKFREENVEAIFLFISTYALSHTVLPVVQKVGVPVIVLNLQPVSQIDYKAFNKLNDRGKKTGEWLAHCQSCAVPEISSVFKKAKIPFFLVTGYLKEEYVKKQIENWVSAVRVRKQLGDCRIGILGHYYGGMLDVYTDITLLSSTFGTHFEVLEMCELKKYRDNTTDEDVSNKRKEFESEFDVSSDCDEFELERAARTSCALDALVSKNQLGAMAYYYEGSENKEYENIVTSVIAGNTLLTKKHVPISGECEIKNAVAMKILDALGSGGSFSELYAIDFDDDIVLWGHDGPAHPQIAEGGVGLVPLPVYHGKPGKGLSIQMSVQYGAVTLLAVVQDGDGNTKLLVAEGESVPGPVLEIGNTNSRYRFTLPVREFVNNWAQAGPSHHCAIGIGHVADKIDKIAKLLSIECQRIC